MFDFESRIEGQLRFAVAEAPHFTRRPAPLQVRTLNHHAYLVAGSLFGGRTIDHISKKLTDYQRDGVVPKVLSRWI
jgi:hypothetical protein